mgnify:CR=1 FL=1
MEIREITGNKRRYLPLLLVGDEQEEMVMRYLPHGSQIGRASCRERV